VNGGYGHASARIQGSRLKRYGNDGAMRRRKGQEDNAMMRTFAAALLATALIAGPAFAASTAGNTGNTAAAAHTVKPAKTAKTHHIRKHRHDVARHRDSGKLASVHHVKRHKGHGHYLTHVAKPVQTNKTGKSDKS
jgi:hypothetical protein